VEEPVAITLYDLAGAEAERRFSPFCWRTKMALAHKGLEVATGPGRALTRFVQNWTETVLQPALIGFVVLDICRHSAPQDQAYFRQSREERFGTTLENVVRDRAQRLPAFRDSLTPLRRTLERQKFLGGDAPPPMPITSSSAPSSGRARSAISSCSPPTTQLRRGAAGSSTRSAAWRENPQPMAAEPHPRRQ
jgi:hypothetical protein